MDFLALRTEHGPKGPLLLSYKFPYLGETVCKMILEEPKIIKWAESTKFDLVVIDGLYNDCGLGFAYKWGAQTIVFGTSSVFEWWPDTYGFYVESSIGNLHNGQNLPLTFFDRVVTTLAPLYFRYTKVKRIFPAIEPILREKLNIPDMPPLAELESNTSLILMNTHFSEEMSRSLPPLIIPIGGMHCTENPGELSQEIIRFIEGGENGFIYVSFGSGIKVSSGPKELTQVIFNAFKNTKIRFIWKWDGTRPSNMPDNVYTASWLNQQALLAHPNIRAFITHGGLLSTQEAAFHGVPTLLFEIFADQTYNAERVHRLKRGIRLEITTITQKELEDAIDTIITDGAYSKNAKTTSVIFKDRPQKPVDTALWWVEYVLRHKDTNYLRPLSITQTWYERRFLDVWAFLSMIFIATLFLTFFMFKKLVSCCFETSWNFASVYYENKFKLKQN